MTESASGRNRLTITHMGAAAQRYLAPGEHGAVLAIISGLAYLRTASQEILWLASSGSPMHRRCARVATPLPQLEAGTPFSVDGYLVRIGQRVILDGAMAVLWQPCPISTGQVVRLAELPARVRALASTLDMAEALGLGQLIPRIVFGDTEAVSATQDPVLQRAVPLVLEAARAFRREDGTRAAVYAGTLVGLGAGLTPSGDDFLGGLLFAVSVLRTAYPGIRLPDQVLLEPCRARTHPISFTLLTDHARGHAIAPLHSIVNGILTGVPLQRIHTDIEELVRVGHSTGWDTLAGLFAGLLTSESGVFHC